MKEAHEDLNPSIAPEFRNEPERFYVPQFATAATVEQEILNRETADMNRPEWNWCGICCVQMILRSLGDRRIPSLEEMYERATSPYRVYRVENQRVVGAYHKELARYIQDEFALSARTERGLTLPKLIQLVREGIFIIASVSPEIRGLDGPAPPTKNGHFVLIYGAYHHTHDGDQAIILHNSAGFQSQKTQHHVRVPVTRFLECFSGNAILVQP